MGMTNGEMIQKVFTCEVCEPIPEDDIIHVIFSDKSDSAIGFDWSWWNMEFKEPTTKNDLGVDCIDRQAAITFVCKNTEKILKDTMSLEVKLSDDYIYENIAKILRNPKVLPSVTPQEPRTGHWIPTYGNVKCSVCGSVKDSREVGKATHYCDFCGAKMVEPQESEENNG